ELFNTAMERMVDAWCMDPSPVAKVIKDVSAGAVLWVVVMVTIVACLLLYRQVVA
ncbi:diacylglycerol kinase family protein, partial [bacterium]|nr:diacylglycerol kinase family protein [bacterium]